MKRLTKLPHMPLSFLSHVRTLPCRLQRNTRGGKRGSQRSGAYILNIHDVTSESFNFSSRSSQTHAELNLTAVKSTQTIKRSYCTVSQVTADGDRLSLYSDKVRHQHQEVRFVDGKWCMAEQPAVSWPVPPQPLRTCVMLDVCKGRLPARRMFSLRLHELPHLNPELILCSPSL